jgi:hypothetical protein
MDGALLVIYFSFLGICYFFEARSTPFMLNIQNKKKAAEYAAFLIYRWLISQYLY